MSDPHARVKAHFEEVPGVTVNSGRGAQGLKVRKKMVAMLSKGDLLLKLPPKRQRRFAKAFPEGPAVHTRWLFALVLCSLSLVAACQENLTSSVQGSVFLGPALLNPLEVGDSIVVTATGVSADGPGPYSLGTPLWSSDDPTIVSVTALPTQSLFGEQARARVVALSAGETTVRVDTRAGQASMTILVMAASPDA